MTSNRKGGPTPGGGDYSEIFYFDNYGKEAGKDLATKAVIRECLEDGTLVCETFANLKGEKALGFEQNSAYKQGQS